MHNSGHKTSDVYRLLSSYAVIPDPWEEGNLTEPWIPSENDPHQQLFSFALWSRIEFRCWPGNSLHWSGTACEPRAACKSLSSSLCAAEPTCAVCLADLTTGEQSEEQAKSAAQVGLGKPNKGQWVCADWCNAWTRDGPSESSFWLLPEKVQKAMKLGQDSQSWRFSVKLQMMWARKRQAVQSRAQTILLSAPWLYCSSCAKLRKCRGLQSRKDKL